MLTLDKILNLQITLEGIEHPYLYFMEYLQKGYYPFGIEEDFSEHLTQVVHQTMQIDIPRYAKMPAYMGRKLEQLMVVIAKSVPFKPSMQSLADATHISSNVRLVIQPMLM